MQCDTFVLSVHSLATAALVLAAVRCGIPRALPVELTVRYHRDTDVNLDIEPKEPEENDCKDNATKDSPQNTKAKSPNGFWGRGWTDAACE